MLARYHIDDYLTLTLRCVVAVTPTTLYKAYAYGIHFHTDRYAADL